jgi:hypothetical protein
VLTLNKNNMTARNEWEVTRDGKLNEAKPPKITSNDLYRAVEKLRNAWAHQVITTGCPSTYLTPHMSGTTKTSAVTCRKLLITLFQYTYPSALTAYECQQVSILE